MNTDSSLAVSMDRITKRFPGILANDLVDFSLARGEIHALLGENGAGKSTLMNILAGLYRPDSGSIALDGASVSLRSPKDAIAHGIGMVHQHFMLVSAQTVTENILLGTGRPRLWFHHEKMAAQIADFAKAHGFDVDARAPIWQLSVGEQQRVEILKALHRGARTLILDEPTAVLTPSQVTKLFDALREMVAEGKSVIIISHKLSEVLDIADRVTVLRRGRNVANGVEARGMTRAQLAHLMVGREVVAMGEPLDDDENNGPVHELSENQEGARDRGSSAASAEPWLRVEELRVQDDRGLEAVRGLSLSVRGGEIYGIAGVSGNGQRELLEALAGLRPIAAGAVRMEGREVTGSGPGDLQRLGVAYVPEDRHVTASAPGLSVAHNLVLKSSEAPDLGSRWLLDWSKVVSRAKSLVEKFDIAVAGLDVAAATLSGGNLQKVILARETYGQVKLLLAAQPTRGLDIGATQFVHDVLRRERDDGRAVLLVSEDLDELLALCDRVGVIYQGRLVGEMEAKDADMGTLGEMMTGSSGPSESAPRTIAEET